MADSDVDWDRMVLVGVIARTHGLHGEIVVNLATDFAEERYQPGSRLFVRRTDAAPELLDVTAVRFHKGRPLLTVKDVDSIEAAEKFAGAEIRIPPEDQQELPEGVYFHSDLVGCDVITAAGESVGVVTGVQGEGSASRLLVASPRGEVMIPLAVDICQVDLANRRVVVTPPPGLLELNGEWR